LTFWKGDRVLPSFEERSVWVQLVAIGLALAGYASVSGAMLSKGIDTFAAYVPLFMVSAALIVVLLVIGHIIAAVVGRPERRDERDRLIGWRAESNSSWLLGTGIFGALTAMALEVPTVWVAHILLGAVYASEMLKLALQAVYYRRGC
jgi:hypothetical protein